MNTLHLPKRKRGLEFIYGLFDGGQNCRYIGRTRNPRSRAHAHRISKKKRGLRFVLLEATKKTLASARERHFIEFYKTKRDIGLNKKTPRETIPLYVKRGDMRIVFDLPGKLHAALLALAKDSERSKSFLLRAATHEYLSKLGRIKT